MNRKLVAILVVGAVVMGVTAWYRYQSRPPEIANEDRRYMHCQSCEKELRYDERKYDKECVFCGKGPFVATKESIKKTGPPPSPFARVIPPLLIEATLLAAAVYWFASRKIALEAEEEHLYVECARCNQRLRYKAAKIGHLGQCPRCKRRFIFPPEGPDEEDQSRWWTAQWWRARGWLKKPPAADAHAGAPGSERSE